MKRSEPTEAKQRSLISIHHRHVFTSLERRGLRCRAINLWNDHRRLNSSDILIRCNTADTSVSVFLICASLHTPPPQSFHAHLHVRQCENKTSSSSHNKASKKKKSCRFDCSSDVHVHVTPQIAPSSLLPSSITSPCLVFQFETGLIDGRLEVSSHSMLHTLSHTHPKTICLFAGEIRLQPLQLAFCSYSRHKSLTNTI